MTVSQSPYLGLIAAVFGTIPSAFGINSVLRPDHALSFFHFEDLRTPGDEQLVKYLMIVYGVRDVFMGLALWLTLYFGTRKALGAVMIGTGLVAIADGVVCKMHGTGEWDHWGYSPVLFGIGLLLMGAVDSNKVKGN